MADTFSFVTDMFNDMSTVQALSTLLDCIPSEIKSFAIVFVVVLLLALIVKVILNVL